MVLRGSGESDGPPQVHQHGTPKSTLPCPTQAVCMIHRVQRVGRNKDGPEIGVLGAMNGSTAIGSVLATGLQQERDGKFGKGRDAKRYRALLHFLALQGRSCPLRPVPRSVAELRGRLVRVRRDSEPPVHAVGRPSPLVSHLHYLGVLPCSSPR